MRIDITKEKIECGMGAPDNCPVALEILRHTRNIHDLSVFGSSIMYRRAGDDPDLPRREFMTPSDIANWIAQYDTAPHSLVPELHTTLILP